MSPLADLPRPRARAALPVARVERLPVSLEIASSIRPASRSIVPSVLSRREDLRISCSFVS
jgi:hypothetical protein